MTQFPAYAAGQLLTAAMLQKATPITNLVTVDQSVSSANTGTTFVNATNVSASLDANADYEGMLKLYYNSGTTGDFKYTWTVPSGSSSIMSILGPDLTAAASNLTIMADIAGNTMTATYTAGGTGSTKIAYISFGIQTASAGTLQFQFAQNTSDATNTTVKAGTRLLINRVG